MTLKTFALMLALTGAALPAMAGPDCGMTRADDRQAMTCLPGSDWNPATGTCVPVVTS